MTFPVIEIYCSRCHKPMTLINQPSIEDCVSYTEYDKQVDYHYQCKEDEKKQLIIMRILIPKLNLDNYNESVATTATMSMIDIKKRMREDGFKFNETKDPDTNLLLNIPKAINTDLGHSIIEEKIDDLNIIELKKKIKLVQDKYPKDIDYNFAFIQAGAKVIRKNPFSDEGAYEFMKDIAEMVNPKRLHLPQELYINQLGDNMKKFMNDCLDILINEDSLD